MKMKKILSGFLFCVMVLGSFCLPVSADGTVLPEPVNGVITLSENVTLSEPVCYSSGTITIDLNGFLLTSTGYENVNLFADPANESVLNISGTADVTIKDSSQDKTGLVIAGSAVNCRPSPASTIAINGGTLTIDGAAIKGATTINCKEGSNALDITGSNTTVNIVNDAKISGGDDITDTSRDDNYGDKRNTYGASAIYIKTNGTLTITDSEVIGGQGIGGSRNGGRAIEMPCYSYDRNWDTMEFENIVLGTLYITDSTIKGGDSEKYNAAAPAMEVAANGLIQKSQILGGNAEGIGGTAVLVGSIAPPPKFVNCTITGGNGNTSWPGTGVELKGAGGFQADECIISGGQGTGASSYGGALWLYQENKDPIQLTNCELVIQSDVVGSAISGTATGEGTISVDGELKIKREGKDTATSDLLNEYVDIVWETTPKILYADATGTNYREPVVYIENAGYLSIAEAMEAAGDNDILKVMPGTYTEDIVIDKPITLQGTDGAVFSGTIQVTQAGTGTILQEIDLSYDAASDPIGTTNTSSRLVIEANQVQVNNSNFYAAYDLENATDSFGMITTSGTSQNVTFNTCTFQTNTNAIFPMSDTGRIEDCTFKPLDNGDTRKSLAISAPHLQNVVIQGNAFYGMGIQTNQAVLQQNTFYDFNTPVITIEDPSEVGEMLLSGNYWGSTNPDFNTVLGSLKDTAILENYYTIVEANGDLSGLVTIAEDVGGESKQIVFEQVANTNEFNVYLYGTTADGDPAQIENLVALDFVPVIEGSFSYTFTPGNTEWTYELHDDVLSIHEKGNLDGQSDLSGQKILLGKMILEGYGAGKLSISSEADSKVVQRSKDGQNTAINSVLTAGTACEFTLNVPTQTLTINITFPNTVTDNAAVYQDMQVTISGGDLSEKKIYTLGIGDGNIEMNDEGGYTINTALTQNIRYNITVEGAGYRTARYSVNMNADKKLTFWNNVKDTVMEVEENNPDSAVSTTFLAGDIVKDNLINLYDLSAVVSYFGQDNLIATHPEYAKYDLNRDGKIDSSDVAYVLVSWGK